MKPGLLRIALYSVVALALAGALRFTPQLPDPERKPAEILVAQAATPSWKLRFDTLGRGESLASVLRRGAGRTSGDTIVEAPLRHAGTR